NLASAYGLSVSGTMLITTILTFFVVRYCWHYKLSVAIAATALFAIVDAAFVAANLVKFVQGGWFPVAAGLIIFSVMSTWRTGRQAMLDSMYKSRLKLDAFLSSLLRHPPERIEGNAVFLVGDASAVPHSLVHNLKHNKVLHRRNVFLTVIIEEVPVVPTGERLEFEALGNDCFRVMLHFGFKEEPDVPQALALCAEHGLALDMMDTSFFLSREKVLPITRSGLSAWRNHLFAAMARNAGSIVDYFNIPANRVIELGTLVEI
ncbi:MAG TPA: KUP/HAK/KT family potassium transporter, partial [Burkholderiales bacterium]|nr:KUP/HAK/KT family potassium transporter [Burkholderiales bacterium]